MEKKESDLKVIMKSRDLFAYIVQATEKSPKNYRFTFVDRLYELCMDVLEKLLYANDIHVTQANWKLRAIKRQDLQYEALSKLRVIGYFSMIARDTNCLLPKQHEQIILRVGECIKLLQGWIKSDNQRFKVYQKNEAAPSS